MITLQQFREQAAAGYNRIPLVQELLADLDTPLSIYLKLANRPSNPWWAANVSAAIPLSACRAAPI